MIPVDDDLLTRMVESSINQEVRIANLVSALEQAHGLLKRLEWASCDGCGARPEGHCLMCSAPYWQWGAGEISDYKPQHEVGCEMARTLKACK